VKDNEISKRFQNTIWNNQHFPSMQDKRLIVVLYYAEKIFMYIRSNEHYA